MNVLQLSESEYAEWLVAAQPSLGGTAAAVVSGLNRFVTPQMLWEELLQLRPHRQSNHHMRRGIALEELAAQEYGDATGRVVWRVPRMVHPTKPWIHASPDRFISDPKQKVHGVLEIKCPAVAGFQRMKEDGIDPGYVVQLQHYLHVANVDWGSFAVFNGDIWQMFLFDVRRDDKMIALVEARLDAFWHENIVKRKAPDPVTPSSDLVRAASGQGAEFVERTDAPFIEAMRRLRAAHEAQRLADQQKTLAVEAVKQLLGEPCKAKCAVGRVAWIETTTTTLDRERLAADYPEIPLAEYERRTAGTRFTPSFPA